MKSKMNYPRQGGSIPSGASSFVPTSRDKIKKIIIILLLIVALIGGFFKIKEYRIIKTEQEYSYCTIECDKEARDSRDNLKSDENGEKDRSALLAIASKYEACLDVCVNDYKKITGKEIIPLYKVLKKEWRFNTSP